MNILFAAIKKEIRQLKRNVSLLVIIGASPLLIMGIIPFSIEKRVKISLSVVDCDNSAASRIMTYRVKASPYFVKVTEMERVEEALDRVKENKSDMVMILPEKMERDAGEVEAAPLSIALDGTMRKLTDVTKLNNLGWKHKIEVEEGVQKLYNWYIQNI